MKLWLVAVGRARADPARALYRDYVERLTWPFTLREVEIKRKVTGAELRRLEAEALLTALPNGAAVAALDERGIGLTSAAFAARLGAWRDGGVGDLAFVVGGADGLDDSVRQRADLLLSFGVMTWPHMMVRAMLAEQLYRADRILAGHPYHRG
ncbi:Ribosomal RNA large subunit methyltransferase H [uncultured Gammaproteobacteria bacterium]